MEGSARPIARLRIRSVPMLTDLPKRVLLGRAMRSDTLRETLLPKRIALPVFASDALSSVAYATQEILLVLVARRPRVPSRYAPWVGLAVVVVMVTVVAAYRQNVHAYPSGRWRLRGRHDQPRAATSASVVASALLVDYVLTVAVSVSAGVENLASTPCCRSLGRAPGRSRRSGSSRSSVLLNLRGVRESGHGLRDPDLRLHRSASSA